MLRAGTRIADDDDTGNLLTAADAAVSGGTQTQTFTYDDLDRLSTATTSGGTGGTYAQKTYSYNNAGNVTSFEGSSFTYDTTHKHGIKNVGGVQKYWYDANGNVTRRINFIDSQDITLSYDHENRLTSVTNGASQTFVYDGDGNLVKRGSVALVGNYYEQQGGAIKKHYYIGSMRVAVRPAAGTAYWLLSDHLGSTALRVNSSGDRQAEQRYMPFGLDRHTDSSLNTAYLFTGQRIESSIDLYFLQQPVV